MAEPKEKFEPDEFLSRWSRLKRQAQENPPAKAQTAPPAIDPRAPPPELPPVDTLNIDSDFRGFFHPKVDENLRRAALKKLFSDPHFNVMDGLDVYIDDYSKPDPMPAAMVAGLRQAQKILAWAKETKEDSEKKAAGPPVENVPTSPAEQGALPVAEDAQPTIDQPQNTSQRVEARTTTGRKA